ncbi:MAG TPA: trehalose-phosphatase [Solirubrobacteraceae bacterium]|nr:trehalose-phosphatase [Solirubrobacteraceae bacterium]
MTLALSEELLAPLRRDPAHAALLLDIDGTLAPIADHAADAHVPEPTRRLLIAAARRFGLVGCISGRRASEARAMVSIGSINYVGSHGAELLRAGRTQAVLDPAVAAWMDTIRAFGRQADTAQARRARLRMEDKGAIVAFHWRGAPDEAAALSHAREIARSAQEAGLATYWGRKVLEVRPPVRIDKGEGVARLLDECGAEIRAAMYIGDDTTDLDAFAALDRLVADGRLAEALRVGVRSDESPSELAARADLVVDGPDGVRALLARLADGSADE